MSCGPPLVAGHWPGSDAGQRSGPPGAPAVSTPPVGQVTPVFSPFKGKAELVELKVRIGDVVTEGQVVAAVEAMKAKHDVRAPVSGRVVNIDAEVGADVKAGDPILTIGQ